MLLNPRLFILPAEEFKEYGAENLTYGSLTPKGLKKMAAAIAAATAHPIYGLDLGCGDGELIYHLAAALPDSQWEGVEISAHRVSMQVRDVSIWQGDMLAESFRPYNVLHADNLCLTDDVADRLEEKIAREFHGLYISYRQPANLEFLRKATHLKSVPIETTWTTHSIHFFELFF